MERKWIKRWKAWVAPTKLPGVWMHQKGGYLVLARITDPTTGRRMEIRKVLPHADEASAYSWLSTEKARIQAGSASVLPLKQRFCDYATSLLERKIATGEIKSAEAGRFDVVAQLAHELEARRLARVGNVVRPDEGERGKR
jgi:hypothetical protein